MGTSPLLANFIYDRVCKLKCEKFLTLPPHKQKPGGIPAFCLSKNPVMHQARTGFFAYMGKNKRKAKGEPVSFQSHPPSFFKFNR